MIMTIFQRLVAYVAEFDPRFPDAIAGAAPDEIDELQALVGAPLPEIYHDFLALMGKSMDWITIRRMDLRIGTVLDYYRRERWLPGTRIVRIGTEHEEPRLHPFLEIDLAGGDSEVVCMPACRPEEFEEVSLTRLEPVAGSLQELVAMPVFRMLEVRAGGRVPAVLKAPRWSGDAWDGVQDVMASASFETLWFSSRSGRAFHRGGDAVAAIQLLGYPLQLFIGIDAEPKRALLAAAFMQRLPDLRLV
jgi:hypothetical protein